MHGLTVAGFVFHLRGRRRKFLEKLLTAQFFFFHLTNRSTFEFVSTGIFGQISFSLKCLNYIKKIFARCACIEYIDASKSIIERSFGLEIL